MQRRKEEFNVVLLHPDDGSVESWTAEGNADKMRSDFSDFEPRYEERDSYSGVCHSYFRVEFADCSGSSGRPVNGAWWIGGH